MSEAHREASPASLATFGAETKESDSELAYACMVAE